MEEVTTSAPPSPQTSSRHVFHLHGVSMSPFPSSDLDSELIIQILLVSSPLQVAEKQDKRARMRTQRDAAGSLLQYCMERCIQSHTHRPQVSLHPILEAEPLQNLCPIKGREEAQANFGLTTALTLDLLSLFPLPPSEGLQGEFKAVLKELVEVAIL